MTEQCHRSLWGAAAGWRDVLAAELDRASALAIGLFDSEGGLLAANPGMARLLNLSHPSVGAERFQNPTFEKLRADESGKLLVFDGMITIGDMASAGISLPGRFYRAAGEILCCCEPDLTELEEMNQKLGLLAQDVSTLQRELIREKQLLSRALDELKRAQQMLVHSEKMNALGQLVAGVAHEVNNPLSFVQSNLHSLKRGVSDLCDAYDRLETLARAVLPAGLQPKLSTLRKEADLDFLRQDLSQLHSASIDGLERVQMIAQKLRAFSRHDESARKATDLVSDLRSTLSLVARELRDRKIEVQLELNPIEPFQAYPADLNQAFLNVIINAAQAMPEGGLLKVRVWEEDGQVCIAISDSGHGIAPELQQKVFEPFFTTRPVGQGTGLGLSIVHTIVTRRHHGSIELESATEQGTTVTIRLPAERDVR